jgi:hypothetical protein
MEQAAWFTGTLWEAITGSGGTGTASPDPGHLPAAFDPGWLASLPLPLGADRTPGQPVALLDARHAEFERHSDAAGLAAAYAGWPRTRVLEDIAAGQRHLVHPRQRAPDPAERQ